MRPHLQVWVAAIALAPVLFWMLATGVEVARRDPDAFETPLAYLAVTWLLYVPVLGVAGAVLLASRRFFRLRSTLLPWLGAVAGGGLAVLGLAIAAATYRLPMRVWPSCLIVGAAMGAVLVRNRSH